MLDNWHTKINFIWSIADLIRDTFRRGRYQDVILPFTVLRRIDSVLEPTKDAVLETCAAYEERFDTPPDQLLRQASGYAFYNVSPYTFEQLLSDPANLAENLCAYIASFSPNLREVLARFDFDNSIRRLDQAGLLLLVIQRFAALDLHPDRVPNADMGYIFEELIRKFNEALNENPGEHFTPREVIRLMVNLLLAPDRELSRARRVAHAVADPCCGTGGMLIVAQELIQEINPQAEVRLYGQEVNPSTFAVCKADFYLKSAGGRDAENIKFGSTLARDQYPDVRFDYQLTNPPYGKNWQADRAAVEREAAQGHTGRFGAGTPRVSDGQLLFLQHMLSRMKEPAQGGGRIAIVMSSSPLFVGGAGSGESEIRRWILENDWLEAIVALPEQLFYNTGIATYVWLLSNRKEPRRRGKVQLIDAVELWEPMRKSLGNKRRTMRPERIAEAMRIYTAFEENERSKILPNTEFGYRKVSVERPLRDERGEICHDARGHPQPDPALRDTEQVTLDEDVNAYLEREVKPHRPDAWINRRMRDKHVGYKVNFRRYFYRFQIPRRLSDVGADLCVLEAEIAALLRQSATLSGHAAAQRPVPSAPLKKTNLPWLEEIPSHWAITRLKFVASVTMGQSPRSADYDLQERALPFLQGSAEFGLQHPTPKRYCAVATKQARPGDLLLSVRAPVGALNIADQRYGIGRGLCAITPDERVLDHRYTWYLLQVARVDLRSVATGATYDAVSVDQVRNLRCPLPPLAEQRAIAAHLDRETARLDALSARVRETVTRLQECRSALVFENLSGLRKED